MVLNANGLAFPSLSSRKTIGIQLRQDFLGAGVKLYAILARAFSVVNIHLMRALAVFCCFFPCGDFADEALGVVDSAIQALAAEHSDLDLDHVGPAGMLRL
jgi:hypothetical protein